MPTQARPAGDKASAADRPEAVAPAPPGVVWPADLRRSAPKATAAGLAPRNTLQAFNPPVIAASEAGSADGVAKPPTGFASLEDELQIEVARKLDSVSLQAFEQVSGAARNIACEAQTQVVVSSSAGLAQALARDKTGSMARLMLQGGQFNDADLKSLPLSLRALSMADANDITLEGWRQLARLHRLEVLDLSGCPVGDAGAAALASGLQKLHSLNLENSGVATTGVEAIALRLKALQALNLGHCAVFDEGAKAIATHLKDLCSLNLENSQIGVAGVEVIAGLSNLQALNLRNCLVFDAGAQAIAKWLNHLQWLDLRDSGVGPAGAKAVATLANLRSLRI